MPRSGWTIRSYALTQKALTEMCKVCTGMGAVLAYPVDPPHPEYEGESESMVTGVGALIPCPGCFNPTTH